jgi:hypothetical protein
MELNTGRIIHIPIITNPYVYYYVRRSISRNSRSVKQHLPQGTIWYFNSYWYHKVVNNGNNPRYTLMFYVSEDCSFLNEAVDVAIKQGKYVSVPS